MSSTLAPPVQSGDGAWPLARDDNSCNYNPIPYRGHSYQKQRVPRTFLKQGGSESVVTDEPSYPKRTFLLPIDELAAIHLADQKIAAPVPRLRSDSKSGNVPGKSPYKIRPCRRNTPQPASSADRSARAPASIQTPNTIASGKGTDRAISSVTGTDSTKIPPEVLKWQMWRPDNTTPSSKTNMSKHTTLNVDQGNVHDKLGKLGVTVTSPTSVKQSPPLLAQKPRQPFNSRPSPRERQAESARQYASRGRGSRGQTRPGRSNRPAKWATKAEMAPVDPKKWDRSPWSQKGDDNSVASVWSGNKWATAHVRKFHDETGLKDWNGGWAPPPVDWDNREAFRPEQSVERIEEWMDVIEQAMKNITWAIPIADIVSEESHTYRFVSPTDKDLHVSAFGDIAPRYWIPDSIDSTDPEVFWFAHLKSSKPPPADDGDLTGARPWFSQYIRAAEGCHFLRPIQHNETKGIDPNDESADERRRRLNDHGSWAKAEARNACEIAIRKQKKAARSREQKELKRAMRDHERQRALFEKRRCKPQLDLYVRYATPADLPAILSIYNHHIASGPATSEIEPTTLTALEARFEDIKNKHHAFIVACQRQPSSPDPVLGFAFSDDHHSLRSVFHLTAQVELYVAPDHLNRGVGQCLLDRIVGILDPHWARRYGYPIADPSGEPRGWRTVRDILISFPYYSLAPSDSIGRIDGGGGAGQLEWVSRFLERAADFKRVMLLEDLGIKDGRAVSLCVFRRRTEEKIDLADPPPLKVYGDLPEPHGPDEARVVVDHEIFNSDSEASWPNPGD